LGDKLRAFGNWEVVRDRRPRLCQAILQVLACIHFKPSREDALRPLMVVAHTTKGKGVPEI
jgi:hypothetical protein